MIRVLIINLFQKTKSFSFNSALFSFVDVSLLNQKLLYKLLRVVAVFFLIIYWGFKLKDSYNLLSPFEYAKFMESVDLNIVHIMAQYKFILLVRYFVLVIFAIYFINFNY